MIEKKILTKVKVEQSLLILFATFYIFNVHYPNGCDNFYFLLEIVFLKKKLVGRKPRLAAIVAELS